MQGSPKVCALAVTMQYASPTQLAATTCKKLCGNWGKSHWRQLPKLIRRKLSLVSLPVSEPGTSGLLTLLTSVAFCGLLSGSAAHLRQMPPPLQLDAFSQPPPKGPLGAAAVVLARHPQVANTEAMFCRGVWA